MKKGKRVVLGVVCFLFLLCAGSLCASAAELPDLSLKHCMTVYPWKTGRVTVYETDTLSKKKEVIPYDMCKAVKVSGNAVQISYKVDGTTKKGWVRKEVFLADPDYEAKNAFVVSGFYMPGTPNSSEGYVYIPAGSSGMAVGEVDGKVQIYFKTGNRYRMGLDFRMDLSDLCPWICHYPGTASGKRVLYHFPEKSSRSVPDL